MCGCGEKTNLAPQTVEKRGYVKGQPMGYLRGHGTRKPRVEWKGELPLCACGCGKPVALSKLTDPKRGTVAGQPNRYARGHYDRAVPPCIEEDRGYETPCCIWQGQIDRLGYPRREATSGTVLAHRQIYIAAHGELSSSVHVHHLCKQTDCVRLDHLEARGNSEHLRGHYGITPEKYEQIQGAIRSGEESQAAIARRFGVSTVFIWRLRKSLSS
jgi:hypothetical protein